MIYLLIYLKFWQKGKSPYTNSWLLYKNTQCHIICPVSIQIGLEIVKKLTALLYTIDYNVASSRQNNKSSKTL